MRYNIFVLAIIVIFSIHPQEMNDKFRRFEIIISGFKDKFYNNVANQNRLVKVYLNNLLIHTRTLSNAESERDDDFVFHDVANDYDSSVDLKNYFPRSEILIQLAFQGPLALKVEYYANEELRERMTENDIRCAKNADWVKTYSGAIMEFNYFVSYWCKGYTGKGCQFECDENPSSKYECFYDTGDKICKESQFNNPPDCNKLDTSCDNRICNNHGKCVQYHPKTLYCECDPGYTGENCQTFFCDPLCNPDYGNCTGPNTCTCSPGKTGTFCEENTCTPDYCLNNGECFVLKNDVICNCEPSSFGGKKCEIKCDPPCVFGTCIGYNNIGKCHCVEGFEGDLCDKTIDKPAPIFATNYVSPRIQKIIFIIITIVLVIIALILFGVGSHIRNKKKDKLKVIKGTEMAVQTLQMAQQQTILNSTSRPGATAIQH